MDGESLQILLTNDDGIESTGFRALYDALESVGEVTAVAPDSDKSAVGRALSTSVSVTDHELGYAVAGTPADCVIAGLEALAPETDLVVSGCNNGANLGAYVLGRSGTVSAAVEAAFFDVPAIAVSMYVPVRKDVTFERVTAEYEAYEAATEATSYLAEHALDAGVFEQADYLNVNAPMSNHEDSPIDDETPPMSITFPSTVYQMDAVQDGEDITLHDRIWERMADGDLPDADGSDRRAVVDGRISVSPLTAPHTTERHPSLDELAESYPDHH